MKIVEIFKSIEGEVSGHGQGRITTFIRLAGCNLACDYCDTKKSWDVVSAKEFSILELLHNPLVNKTLNITITGGEPLLQMRELKSLLQQLWDKNITIETNGTIAPPREIYMGNPNVSWVVDYKLGIENSFCFPLKALSKKDFVKFVIKNESQYREAILQANIIRQSSQAQIAFSACLNKELPSIKTLIDWIIKDGLDFIIVNVQIHKIINVK